MSVTKENLIQGPGTLYCGAVGATEPTDGSVATAPSSPTWTDLGATSGGVQMSWEQETKDLVVDQWVDPAGARITGRKVTIKTALAEATLENLAIALNGGTVSSGTGYKKYSPTSTTGAFVPEFKAFIFDGLGPNGRQRRFILRRAINVQNVETEYKVDGMTLWTVTFQAYGVSTSVLPWVTLEDPTP